jgi:hypothetical protein
LAYSVTPDQLKRPILTSIEVAEFAQKSAKNRSKKRRF